MDIRKKKYFTVTEVVHRTKIHPSTLLGWVKKLGLNSKKLDQHAVRVLEQYRDKKRYLETRKTPYEEMGVHPATREKLGLNPNKGRFGKGKKHAPINIGSITLDEPEPKPKKEETPTTYSADMSVWQFASIIAGVSVLVTLLNLVFLYFLVYNK